MLLAFDTATQTASLAVYDLERNQLLAEWTWQARRRQTQDLLTAAQQILAQLKLTPAQLTALAVTTGPGSFTGVRIGVSAAKGIGLGLPVAPKVIGIPTLNVTAASWVKVAGALSTPTTNVVVCPYIQAGRGRYNWSLISVKQIAAEQKSSAPLPRLTVADHQAGTLADFVATLGSINPESQVQPLLLVGEGTNELEEAAAKLDHVQFVDNVSGLRRAGQLSHLAAQYFATGVSDNLGSFQPLYLRNP